jgi:hypothetical protein
MSKLRKKGPGVFRDSETIPAANPEFETSQIRNFRQGVQTAENLYSGELSFQDL